ncbi:MAG: hypothetical protein BWK80_61905 [Desulfobacteraceae bacterium IS3]|nr:MAG: hypothetical protein BWK80_61905 [Desulfobacteraceae bacterium IS3]
MLKIISENLTQNNIPFALIGAMSLILYGLSRYTSGIDLLTEGHYRPQLIQSMEKLGYTCYQKSDSFAQFESETETFGYIDFMFVNTEDGKNILRRCIVAGNDLFGDSPVIQPTDHIILKLMAIANNPKRSPRHEADISAILRLYKKGLIPACFETLDTDRIYQFADKFGQRQRFKKHLNTVFEKSGKSGFIL